MCRLRLVFFLMPWLLVAAAGCVEDQYVQTDCTVKDRYVGIWMTPNGSKKEEVPHQSFSIDKHGITFGVSPIQYAQDWSQIAEINFQKQSNPDVGLLSFKLLEKDGNYFIQPGGIITKECWANIGMFIEKNNVDVNLVTG